MQMLTILDGPMGTELEARGVPTPAPLWSALALDVAPDVVAQIHRDYAESGATIHTTNTFRTKRRSAGDRWEELARRAASITRSSIPVGHRVAGSIAPLEDCYRPDLSPKNPRPEHREVARVLASCGVDLLLCEAFPHVGEALVAVEEAVATGLPTWASFTAGPSGDLLTPAEVFEGAREAVLRGASAVLINCTSAALTLPYVEALSRVGAPFGAYANAGDASDGFGGDAPISPDRYAELARAWISAGATILGSCCATGPRHIRALAALASPP